MHQGWPKFVKSLWYRCDESEVVSMVFAPCRLETEAEGRKICIREETEYPFREKITYHVEQASHDNLEFKIRIPSGVVLIRYIKTANVSKRRRTGKRQGTS